MNQALLIPQSISEALSKHSIIPDIFSKTFDTTHLTQTLLTVEYPTLVSVTMGNVLPIEKVQSAPSFQCLALPSSAGKDTTGEKETENEQKHEGLLATNVIDLDAKYTLVLTDPDAPSRTDKKWSEYCHWIVTGLTATNENNTINAVKFNTDQPGTKAHAAHAETLVPYVPPAPPKGTGPHRYCFCLFKGLIDTHSSDHNELLIEKINKSRANWGYNTPATGIEKFARDVEVTGNSNNNNNSTNKLELVAVNFFYAENK